MIEISSINNAEPYKVFENFLKKALDANQSSIDAMAISSFNDVTNEVESRFVNLKYINGSDLYFFTNYNSSKASDFFNHKQISALFYWDQINTQIRIKANIKKCSKSFSSQHFKNRDKTKNAIAISSNQSHKIESYEAVLENFNKTLNQEDLSKCPDYWGGYMFTPYYFEFWEGNESRINKRKVYKLIDDVWIDYFLQP